MKTTCQLLVAIGEAYSGYLVKHFQREDVVVFIQMMLKLTDYRGSFVFDEEISDLTFNFWFVFHDTILDILNEVSGGFIEEIDGSMESLNNVTSQEVLSATKNSDSTPVTQQQGPNLEVLRQEATLLFTDLVRLLRRKCEFPNDEQLLKASADEMKRFLAYRREIADTLINCFYIAKQQILATLVSTLNDDCSRSNISWQALEATVFCVKAIAEVVEKSEKEYMPLVMTIALSEHMGKHPRLIQTTMNLLGAYAFWINANPENELVLRVLNFISPYLQNADPLFENVTICAFRSLRNLCDACHLHLINLSQSFVDLFLNTTNISVCILNIANDLHTHRAKTEFNLQNQLDE